MKKAEKIYDMVRGYPYYVQKLAAIVWETTLRKCHLDSVRQGYQILLNMEAVNFEGIWSGFTLIQSSVLKAIAEESTQSLYSREFLERHQLSIGGTQRAMNVLFSRDLIEKDSENRYWLTDSVMEAWLRER